MPQQFINSPTWGKVVRAFIRSEMTKKSVDYPELSRRLKELGTIQTADNLRQKVTKGILGTQLFFQICLVLKVRQFDWELIEELCESNDDVK